MPQGELESRSIPNLVEGVSQQDASQRRDTQCELQYDCNNSPRQGVVARNGADFLSYTPGVYKGKAFTYEIIRGTTEHYLVIIDAGGFVVYDLNTGLQCTVTNIMADGNKYLKVPTGVAARDNFRVQTVGDFSFFINKNIAPAMLPLSDPSTTPTRPPEALIFFQSGNYLTTYGITVNWQGSAYTYTYITPDNSVAGNAQYIFTNQLAATFYKAMTGLNASSNNGGQPAGSGGGGSFGVSPAAGGGGTGTYGLSGSGNTLQSLGFSVAIDGNLIRIWRPNDNNTFSIDCTDGGGNTQIVSFQTTVASFSQLPRFGFPGMVFQVIGVQGNGTAASYYVQYVAGGVAGGSWQECPAPGIATTLDPKTMPHALVCTAPGVFEARTLTWLPRICGDGVLTAPNPGFVGRLPYDIFYHESRLAILTDTTCDWTKAKQQFSFFPDTAQAALADCPIGITLAAGDAIALTHRAVKIDESLVLWAQRVQFRVNSGGINSFSATTIQVPESTMYEWSETGGFAKAGTDLYFGFEADSYAFINQQSYSGGKSAGDIEVTAHVQELIPSGLRRLQVSTLMHMLVVQSSAVSGWLPFQDGGDPNLYVYQWLPQATGGNAQSAWNTWRLPVGSVVWHSIYRQTLYVALQVGLQVNGGLLLLAIPLSTAHYDAGQLDYLTRLDLRVTESQCVVTYNPTTNQTTIQLPYSTYSQAQLGVGAVPALMVAIRTTSGIYTRGQNVPVVNVSPAQWAPLSNTLTTVTVAGNLSAAQFYVGHQITSLRKESQFFYRTSGGQVPYDKITLRNYKVTYEKTGYTRVTVTYGNPSQLGNTQEVNVMDTANLGSATSISLQHGDLKIPVDADSKTTSITLINDSFLPSRWQTASWEYQAVQRAPTRLSGLGVPIA